MPRPCRSQSHMPSRSQPEGTQGGVHRPLLAFGLQALIVYATLFAPLMKPKALMGFGVATPFDLACSPKLHGLLVNASGAAGASCKCGANCMANLAVMQAKLEAQGAQANVTYVLEVGEYACEQAVTFIHCPRSAFFRRSMEKKMEAQSTISGTVSYLYEFAKAGVSATIHARAIMEYKYMDFILGACLLTYHLANCTHLHYVFLRRSNASLGFMVSLLLLLAAGLISLEGGDVPPESWAASIAILVLSSA